MRAHNCREIPFTPYTGPNTCWCDNIIDRVLFPFSPILFAKLKGMPFVTMTTFHDLSQTRPWFPLHFIYFLKFTLNLKSLGKGNMETVTIEAGVGMWATSADLRSGRLPKKKEIWRNYSPTPTACSSRLNSTGSSRYRDNYSKQIWRVGPNSQSVHPTQLAHWKKAAIVQSSAYFPPHTAHKHCTWSLQRSSRLLVSSAAE